MLQKILDISAANASDLDKLFIEIGKDQLAVWTTHAETEALSAFELFSWGQSDSLQSIDDLLRHSSTILSNTKCENPTFIWETDYVDFIPSDMPDEKSGHVALPGFTILESIGHQNEQVKFQVATSTWQLMQNHFPQAKHIAKSAAIKKTLEALPKQDQVHIYLAYFQSYITLSVLQKGELLATKFVDFISATDPVYHVLNAARILDEPIENTVVHIAGLIEKDAPIFESLHKFVPNIIYDEVTANLFDPAIFNQIPAHYIVPFIKYAR